jgi:hypothetical protein
LIVKVGMVMFLCIPSYSGSGKVASSGAVTVFATSLSMAMTAGSAFSAW